MSKYMNPIKSVSINFSDEPLLTIHCDGRVTTSDRLKPTETAVLALDQIKTQWMKDAQATKIRELQDQIERLEDWKQSALAVEREWNANAIATMLGGQLGESQRTVIQREVPKLLERIKRLEEALAPLAQMTDIANDADCTVWKRAVSAQSVRLARSVLLKAKEAKP